MAEEVPVSEVLFNATEYLCKLGSNLRSRSQNLKDKRISKDKLRNTHAVRKAAMKLLLMCELSKKSLENVENGVKKVLTIVDASRCSPGVGAKNKTVSKRDDTKKEYFYFEHDSCKLRISKKILLDHYMSVKVHAKAMPASMLDKYPVFYKCNLYRKRRKALSEGVKDSHDKGKENKNMDDEVKMTTKKSMDEEARNCISDILEPASLESERSKKESDNEANSAGSDALSKSSRKTKNDHEDILKKGGEMGPNIKSDDTDDNICKKPDSDSVKKSKSKKECHETSTEKSINQEESEKCVKNAVVEKKYSNEEGSKSPSKPDKSNSSISVNNKLEESESQTNLGSIEQAQSSLDSNETCKTISKTKDKNCQERDKNTKSRKSKSVRFLDDGSDSSETVEGNDRKKNKLNTENQSEELNAKEPEVVSLLDDDQESPEKSDRSDKDKEKIEKNEDSVNKASHKPLIKLVSLNKLLKPDILHKTDVNKTPIRKTYGNKKSKMDPDWLEKKKNVLAFKPKKFNIVVSRMPTFSDEYLCKYNLKKITQNGTVIHKLSSELLRVKDSVKDLSSKTIIPKNSGHTVNIDLTDDANESLEIIDEHKKQSDVVAEKTIETDVLTKKIDSVNKENFEESSKDEPCVQENQSSDSNKLKPDNKIVNTEKENSVEENSLDRPKTPEGKNKKTDETTPRSKRKIIMESMHAKKMLLTYSSSSDTDDDQLRNALSDIKNALLNGSSSDEEINLKKIVQDNHRQLVTPTDSDDSLKIYKKQQKTKKDPFEEKDEESSISQVDGTHDEQSNSSSSQMGRSKTNAASSSNQSSENVDSNDIEINRLSNLNTLNRSRRRRGSTDKVATRSSRRMPKAPLIQEEMLEPESSGSLSEIASDAADIEELPPIAVQELNGDGINHLAKEDLLAQSDSSSSQNEPHDKDEGSEDKKEDSEDDEEKVKSRRRKPNAIDSDSEAGSSRPRADRVSDFEDSSESESRKKTKRKKKGSDSDASFSSTDGSKKKRRRIKQVNESDGSGSDTETEGKNKHGRKNIRKVMSKNQLEEATKKAARQEKERVARIAERQKLYNNLEFDESGKPDEVVLEKVILDFDPETKEPLIEVDRGLVRKLKPHQANGIKFMWNACFESVKRIKKDRGSGCILAHCMGLGKTLQVVSLTHTLLVHSALTKVKRVLVVCPLSTVLNWVNEFNMWLKHTEADYEVDVFELSRHKQNSERSWQLQQWVSCGGVCVLGYEMFRNLSADNNKKFKKKMLKTFQEALVDPGPDLVVCDEGHLLKNEKTSLSQSMNRVRTLRRIVLTGTPLQNNLKEYYCMVQFVKPNLLGKYNEYLNRFVNPITNGQYTDSTEKDISIMKRRSHVLHTMLDGAVQRRDYGVLAPFLPPKHEFVLFITLTDIQTKLYEHYLEHYSRRPLPGKSSGFLFPDFQSLQRIWTHPLVLKYNSERYEIMQQKKRDKEEEDSEGSLADFIDDDSTPEESSTEESSDDLSDASDDSRKKKKKKSAKKGKSHATGRRGTRANPVEQLEEERPNPEVEETKYENPTEWWMKLVTDDELEDIRHSHKLLLLFDILRQCETIGDKLLVFSQSLYSLDLIEHFLGKVDEATQEGRIDEKLAGHVGSWSPGVDYFRLDGSTSCENRSIWCKNFNREDNPRARLFLISTRAGGLGINLVAANRVVIFDVSWNPSHDVQSIFRVYRFGQRKPCYIYRFLAMGTMEEKIYERQVTKQAISKRVIDEQQIDRHYAANDLAELYRFEPKPAEPRPVPSLPKDRLFAEMLQEHDAAIYRFHEHDSLLENKEEETLSEEERKRAWEEFENEKKAPPPAAFPNSWAFSNGMAASLLQQQQQLAYAALAAMIRKDMPSISDAQIRDMLPVICNANPGMFGGYDYGLMQKMSEIYKYAQPGMLNPSMMNPVMNPGGGGMSTSSSLQYEPPWQRQQQQQQQMRLQQLMQQQQGMGAKYYAGGLGSRDPVAMALQQQRAREFLLGGGGGGGGGGGVGVGAGRPRGRPPLQPRAPPADVVNLADSD